MRRPTAFFSCLILLLGLLLPALVRALPADGDKALTIGIVPFMSTGALLRIHEPLARSLEDSLQRPVSLKTAPDYPQFFQRLRNGDYDMVIAPPHFGWLAIRDHGYQALLVHREPIRGILVSAARQPVNSVADLRGATIAITDRSALMAIIGALTLADEGLQENRDYRFIPAVSHSSALHNAVSGKTRAALINATSLLLAAPDIREATQTWRELAVFPGQFYIAPPRLDKSALQALLAALRAFEQSPAGQAFFAATGQGGYRMINDDDRAMLERTLPETRRLLRTTDPR